VRQGVKRVAYRVHGSTIGTLNPRAIAGAHHAGKLCGVERWWRAGTELP